jgi:hypothetical protein
MRLHATLLFCLAAPGCEKAAPPAAVPAGTACEPHRALEKLDARREVPLLPMMANHQRQNMRDHLVAVQDIVTAAAADDFAAIERAAARIGYSEQMGQMCTHMGAGAPGFTETALEFHRTADTIAAAARARDRAGVLRALSATLATCTGCHSTFRQQPVDEATWTRVTASQVPTGHHP